MLDDSLIAATFFIGGDVDDNCNHSAPKTNLSDYRNGAQEESCGKASTHLMAELTDSYSQRLWEAWKDYEKVHGALSGVELARRVQARIGGVFDDSKLSRIRAGKRRVALDEHYALAAELKIDPEKLAGHRSKGRGKEAPEVELAPSGGSPAKKRKEG